MILASSASEVPERANAGLDTAVSSSATSNTATSPEWVISFYRCLDSKDPEGLAARCTEDVSVRLGSDNPVIGRASFVKKLTGLFGAHAAMKHEVLRVWEVDDKAFVEITATHGLPNGREPSAPAFAVLTRDKDLISDVRTFLDRTAFSPTAAKAIAEELGYGS
jgi:ketosteroid isomerase-like protein